MRVLAAAALSLVLAALMSTRRVDASPSCADLAKLALPGMTITVASTVEAGAFAPPTSARADAFHLRVERQRYRTVVAARIGFHQAAADGAAVAHLKVADLARRLAQHRQLRRDQRRFLDFHVAGHGADAKLAAVFANVTQVRNAMDVDQIFGPGEAEFHHRHQTLAAGQELGVVAVAAQQLDGVVDSVGSQIFEASRIHGHIAFLLYS